MDINADLGESFGAYRYGHDSELMPLITSANIACGFHAGDPATMRRAVQSAVEHGVAIGAHVGLPDRLGFGRREMAITADDAYDYSLYQLAALDGFVRAAGARMRHVKPHGALYMMAAERPELAAAISAAVRDFDSSLALYALPGSHADLAAVDAGLTVLREFFADRPYEGTDVVMFGWSYEQLGGAQGAAERVSRMLADPAFDTVQTVCVHSDTVDAPALARSVRGALRAGGVSVEARPALAR
ncbi:LamB/YcsF family protein [Microbacterium sp. A1-JK]|uniref:LamB/YcsF family protein n=1 Tax=Microbacterium sp. A1-JK TaxID=3177516 RepID=UPI0038893255